MSALTVAEVLEIKGHGVRIIVEQGLLDHWFTANHWSGIRPAPLAFKIAEELGLIERQHGSDRVRLTNLGRKHRAALARDQQA